MSKGKSSNQNLKLFTFYFLLFTFYFLLFAPFAHAQTFSLGIYPPLLEVMIQPGKSITQVYKLSNSGDDIVLTSKIRSFEPADEQGNIKFKTDDLKAENDWFSFQNADLKLGDKIRLKSGKTQEIVLKIKVPKKAKEGDYYATLLFESEPGYNLGGSAVRGAVKLGANILITVSQEGKPVKKAEIVEFSFPKIVDSFDRVPITLRIKNTGQAFFKSLGRITISGMLGQKYIADLLPENVLVNSVRKIRLTTSDSPPTFFFPFPTSFLLGPYKAKVEFGLDKVTADYTAEGRFLALPFKALLGLGVASVIVLLVYRIGFQKRCQ